MGKEVMRIYRMLLEGYGEQGWWPIGGAYSPEFKRRGKDDAERLEICIGAILAQNTSWLNAQKAVLRLREAGLLGSPEDEGPAHSGERGGEGENGAEEAERNPEPETGNGMGEAACKGAGVAAGEGGGGALARIGEAELAELIRSAGYYNVKARKIREFLGYSGEASREGLLSVWGLGEETVDSMLLYAYDVPVFVVDAYAKRVFSRLGLCGEGASYGEVQGLFHSSLPREAALFNEYHALIVEHAKRHCRVKPLCGGCPLGGICEKNGLLGKGERGRRRPAKGKSLGRAGK